MTNPFKPHALNLFADRESIDKAMEYAHALLQTLDGPSATAATTALMVVVNTAAKLWPEAPAQEPSPVTLDSLRSRIAALEERLSPEALSQDISSQACAWLDDNFNERADQWLNDEADLDDKIETWVENNLDIENEVADALRDKVYDTVRRVIRDEVSVSISI
jgi:hypothetical protein